MKKKRCRPPLFVVGAGGVDGGRRITMSTSLLTSILRMLSLSLNRLLFSTNAFCRIPIASSPNHSVKRLSTHGVSDLLREVFSVSCERCCGSLLLSSFSARRRTRYLSNSSCAFTKIFDPSWSVVWINGMDAAFSSTDCATFVMISEYDGGVEEQGIAN